MRRILRAASTMLSSVRRSAQPHGSLHVSAVPACRLEAASLLHVPFGGLKSTAGPRWVHRGGQRMLRIQVDNAKNASGAYQVLASNRCYGARTDASGQSSTYITPQRSSLSIRALAAQTVANPRSTLEEGQFENEYEARKAVLKYLKSQEINTTELEIVALPTSVTIMEERIAFLRKIGLNLKDINSYPLMVGCSVKKNLVPVLSYLKKLNVEARFLPDLIRKYPMVLNSSVVMDLEPVVSFLLGIGIEKTNLGKVLTRFPDVLGYKIEGTMSTSLAYLVSLGVNMRAVGSMVIDYPEILGMRVGNNVKPKVDYLISLGIPKEVLAKILEVKPFILGLDLESKIKAAIKDLRDVGVQEDNVARVITQYADVLGLDIKQRLDAKMGWMSKHAGVKREDIGRVLEKLPQILAINISLAQSRVTFLRETGFSVEDIGIMVTKCPQILVVSIDEVLGPSLDFFLKSMRRSLTELVDYPAYFTYSLEKRIRPRYIQVEQKGIRCSLCWFLNCSDSKFASKLMLDYVEKPPVEEEESSCTMGGRLEIKGEHPLDGEGSSLRSIGGPVQIGGK